MKLIKENNKYNYIKPNGELLSPIWFDIISKFYGNLSIVSINDKLNFINTGGDIISNIWFDEACKFNGTFSIVRIYDKGYNFINVNGKPIYKDWFFYAETADFNYKQVRVQLQENSAWLMADGDGNLIYYINYLTRIK